MTDLELLARNVHSWPTHAVAVLWQENEPVWLVHQDIEPDTLAVYYQDWLTERERIQNKPKWEDAPEWANWLAQDSMEVGGSWAWFEFVPTLGSDEWFVSLTSSSEIRIVDSGEVIGDWRQTLEQRPESKLEEETKINYKFKVGDKVEVVKSGFGCASKHIGTISTITELGLYGLEPGYRVDNLENEDFDDFIDEVSFKIHSTVATESDIQHPAAAIERTTPVISTMSSLYPDYYKSCVGVTELDVYTVHHLFNVNDPSGCIQHASKKLLLSGVRTGGKSAYKDIKEARDTLTRKLQLMEQFEENV